MNFKDLLKRLPLPSRRSSPKPDRKDKVSSSSSSQGFEELDPQTSGSSSVLSQEPSFKWILSHKLASFSNISFVSPSDNEEGKREALSHAIYKYALGTNCMSPVEESLVRWPAKCLDVGCGSGLWTIDMAKSFPESEFYGIDILPLFPSDPLLPNVNFKQVNIIEGIPYPNGTFDYVFQRHLSTTLQTDQWPIVMDELFRVVAKGGYVELVEANTLVMRVGPMNEKLQQKALEISQSQGIDQEIVSDLKGLLREAGFVSIKHGFASLPVGKWDSDTKIGEMMGESYRAGMVAVKPFMASQLGMTPKQYDEYCDACTAEYDECQSYANVYWAYAQRPI